MTSPVLTIDAGMNCRDAWHFFKENKLRRAPVLLGKKVLGMLTDRSLMMVQPWTVDEQERRIASGLEIRIDSLLTKKLLSVSPNDHLERAAQIMLRERVGGLPVIDGGELKGIVTESDIFKLFTRRTMTQHGHRLIMRGPIGPLSGMDPAQIAVEAKATILDLAIYPGDEGRTSVVMQVRTPNIQRLVDKYFASGYELSLVEEN
ncbi:MAG: acetoin utilization protein AcuB [Bacteroidia bacterium]|jgi:acetoin utilization protein AcuB